MTREEPRKARRRAVVLMVALGGAIILAVLAHRREWLTQEYYLWRLRRAPAEALPRIVSELWAMGTADKAAPLVLERIRSFPYPDGPWSGPMEALRALGKDAFTPAMELLDDERPEVRRYVVGILADLRGKGPVVVSALLPLVAGDPSPEIRAAAAYEVSRLDGGGDAAIQTLRDAAETDPDPKTRRLVESALRTLLGKK